MKTRFFCFALVGLLTLLLGGCRTAPSSPALSRFEFTEPHMGTGFNIILYAPDAYQASHAAEAAFAEIARLDKMMTDYDPRSELMQLCQKPWGQPVSVSPELFELIQESIRVSRETDGAFDITVGPLVKAWRAARKTGVLPPPQAIAEMRQAIGYDKIRLHARSQSVTLLVPNMQLDLGGIAKGYAADRALAVMRKLGFPCALVAASGDIAIGDAPPGRPGWRIGIQALDAQPNELSKNLWLHNAGVSTSGDTEQFIEINGVRYSHIIDPATCLGMTNHIQTTIIGPNATITDGLDTPTAILGVKRGLALINSQPKLAAVFAVNENGTTQLYTSKRFKDLKPVVVPAN